MQCIFPGDGSLPHWWFELKSKEFYHGLLALGQHTDIDLYVGSKKLTEMVPVFFNTQFIESHRFHYPCDFERFESFKVAICSAFLRVKSAMSIIKTTKKTNGFVFLKTETEMMI